MHKPNNIATRATHRSILRPGACMVKSMRSRVVFLATILACALLLAQTSPSAEERRARLAQHADLFRHYTAPRAVRVESRKPNASGVIDLSVRPINDYMARDVPLTPVEELAELAGQVTSVIRGTTVQQASALNPEHTFLYSDWSVKVAAVIKNSSGVPIAMGDTITVVRPGGNIVFGGVPVTAGDPTFPDFSLNHDYLLYLTADSASSSFVAMQGGSFDITGSSPGILADPKNPTSARAFSAYTTTAFLDAVNRSIAK